jgi:hypothetical protein
LLTTVLTTVQDACSRSPASVAPALGGVPLEGTAAVAALSPGDAAAGVG